MKYAFLFLILLLAKLNTAAVVAGNYTTTMPPTPMAASGPEAGYNQRPPRRQRPPRNVRAGYSRTSWLWHRHHHHTRLWYFAAHHLPTRTFRALLTRRRPTSPRHIPASTPKTQPKAGSPTAARP